MLSCNDRPSRPVGTEATEEVTMATAITLILHNNKALPRLAMLNHSKVTLNKAMPHHNNSRVRTTPTIKADTPPNLSSRLGTARCLKPNPKTLMLAATHTKCKT